MKDFERKLKFITVIKNKVNKYKQKHFIILECIVYLEISSQSIGNNHLYI